ncbi:Esterase-like protein [Hirsutella rhossiliensis]|uniref:Esterase-like protein n=1 Tax=Hirsutella rhossiliensis TaxID=111463 RepID=A0A9P8MYH3_9HYPO|nr:Esterase-like protein [Hirsutella rhossiliensis]KAH0964688.1 Esterase-like protein [Hirsutella rhossiliensis]
MITCTASRTRHLKAAASSCLHRQRWKSYDAASLTREALTQKIEAGLGEGVDGKPLRIDADSKTIATASGSLPLSPVLDPVWIKAKRQPKKAPSQKPGGRFRKKLANNPYARALETPIRKCANAAVSLPRYFLQDFEVVKHPATEEPWWVPGQMAIKFVQQRAPLMGDRKDADTEGPIPESVPEFDPGEIDSSDSSLEQQSKLARSAKEPVAKRGWYKQFDKRPEPGPITSYVLCRKSVIDLIGGPNKKYAAMLQRNGMAITPETRNTVWREDMGDVMLDMFRRYAVDALISWSHRQGNHKHRYIQPCASWDDVGSVVQRGCVLWLPSKPESATCQYVTFDVEGAKYGNKIAVHNLFWLFGGEEVERLRREAPIFRDNEVLVLTQWDNIGIMRLHLLLWRLQGIAVKTVRLRQASNPKKKSTAGHIDLDGDLLKP